MEDQIFKRMTYINSMADFSDPRHRPEQGECAGRYFGAGADARNTDAKRATFQDASALADAIARIENKNKATKLAIGGSVRSSARRSILQSAASSFLPGRADKGTDL